MITIPQEAKIQIGSKLNSTMKFLIPIFLFATIQAKAFDPIVQNVEGWTIHVDPALLQDDPNSEESKSLKMLKHHLYFITLLVPEPRLSELRTLEIWIEKEHPKLRAMQYHPSGKWLSENGYDQRLAKKVHIPVANQLIARSQLMKHPMVVLHELAHAYHDQILGFDDPRITKVFGKARESGKYRSVLLYSGRRVLHYGMTNHKEYFAEGTEAYFNRNDFYPFVQAELKEHDPAFHSLLLEIWGPTP